MHSHTRTHTCTLQQTRMHAHTHTHTCTLSTMPNTDIAAVPNYQLFSPDCVGSHPSLHLALIPSIPSSIHSSLLSSSISSPHPFIPRSISPYIQVSPCILSYPSFLPLSFPPFFHHSLIHAFLLFVFFPVILLSIHFARAHV